MQRQCKGTNCTSDGTTPHSAECESQHGDCANAALLGDVLNTALNDGYLNSTQHTELTAHADALVRDATLYRAMRAIATEPNAAIRERMLVACEAALSHFVTDPSCITDEQYDVLYTAMIAAANGARNADG